MITSENKINSYFPLAHREPFDSLIIAQALAENINLISFDLIFSQYPVRII